MRAYEAESTLTQIRAATAPERTTAALPVSVRRNWRSGVSTWRAQAVRFESPELPARAHIRASCDRDDSDPSGAVSRRDEPTTLTSRIRRACWDGRA